MKDQHEESVKRIKGRKKILLNIVGFFNVFFISLIIKAAGSDFIPNFYTCTILNDVLLSLCIIIIIVK